MLQITISNNIRIRGLTSASPLKLAILDALTMDNPEFIDREKKRRSTWGLPKKLQLFTYDQGDIVTGRGFLEELSGILNKHNVKAGAQYNYNDGLDADFGEWTGPQPRDYQAPAIAAIVAANGTLVSPAGSGKTFMGMKYIHTKGRCALWLTHTSDLMKQAKENAEKYLGGVGRIGLIGDGKVEWGDGKLIIAMAQTLGQNPNLVDQLNQVVGTVVIDEAHHFPAPLFMDVVNQFRALNVIGVTATPDRKDGLERFLYVGIGPIRHEVPRAALNAAGQLVIPELRFVYTNFDYDPASIVSESGAVDAGGEELDYRELLNNLIDDEARLDLVANKILENAPNNYSLVLTESVRYCFMIRDAVERLAKLKGIMAPRMAVVHGGLTQYEWRHVYNEKRARKRVADGKASDVRYNEGKNRWEVRIQNYTDTEMEAMRCTPTMRKQAIQDMRDKKLDILFATQLAREGLDIPHLNILHMATPKRGDTHHTRKDGGAVEQEAGRIQRPDPTNPQKKAILFDYVDYNVGVFRDQYYSRRKVYGRLGMKVPKKQKTEADRMDAFLGGGFIY
jgi:superfamily II DNA or RNA helicase